MDDIERTAEASRESASADGLDPRIEAIIVLVRKNLSRRINITELSAFVRLSPSGLRRLFKQQLGCSIGQWQRSERLRTARHLLCTSYLSVKEINAAIGYHDLSHFVRDFELAFGLSPKRFRRAHFDATVVLRADEQTNG
jgi:transcriptional regulator GlxA family with amidase domain